MRQLLFVVKEGKRGSQSAMAPLIGELSAKLTERLRGMRRGR